MEAAQDGRTVWRSRDLTSTDVVVVGDTAVLYAEAIDVVLSLDVPIRDAPGSLRPPSDGAVVLGCRPGARVRNVPRELAVGESAGTGGQRVHVTLVDAPRPGDMTSRQLTQPDAGAVWLSSVGGHLCPLAGPVRNQSFALPFGMRAA